MQRRQLIRYAGAGLLGAVGSEWMSGLVQSAQAQSGGVSVQFLGHMCFVFSGSGTRVLVNPFKKIGCTAGYPAPTVSADVVLLSSQLFDEGYIDGLPGDPRILYEPGVYETGSRRFQGIRTDHDRRKGRQFGINTVWQWEQGGLKMLHLGGIAAPITVEQKILMGRPDILCVPVGGGPKAYTAEEARQAIQVLNPRIVIPTQYRTGAAAQGSCDIQPLESFLSVAKEFPVKRVGGSFSASASSLPKEGTTVYVMD